MVIKLIPFVMDKETAATQIKLVEDAIERLVASREKLESLREGQTAVMWTSDGRSVALAAAFTERYVAAVKWLDGLEETLIEARDNLNKAVTETNDLDEQQDENYQIIHAKAVGSYLPRGTVAV